MDPSLVGCILMLLLLSCTSKESDTREKTTHPLTLPDEPTDFNATVNSSSTVTVFWTPSTHEAGPTYYIIEVSGDVDQTTHNCTDMKTLNITGYNASSAVVENLCSYSHYNFTIMACTSEANSSSVSLNTSVLTGIGVPDGPTDFNSTVNSSSTVTLFWTPSTHEAGPTYYIIEVSGDVDQTTHNCTDMKTLNITGYNASSAVVENLCSYSHYNFTIMACTSEANSSSVSLNTSVLTGIGVPDGPTDFNSTVNSSSTVTLFWTPSTHEAGPTYYIIEVSGDVDQTTHNCTDMKTLNITGYNASSAVVENLCSYSHYNFTIMACTSEANSSSVSLNTSVLTGIGVPDGPTDFNATVNSSSTVTLFWTPSTHEAGPTYYIIEVSGDVDQTTHNCTDMNTLNITGYNASSAVVENLCSYSHYNFTIMACTSEANSSSVSLNTSVLTGIGVPDGPTDFNATVNSSSTVTLFWTPSTHEAGPTYYIIEVSGDVDQTTHNCTDMNTLNITGYNVSSAVVENLCSYSQYNFTIMACTSEANSSSVSLNTSVLTGIGVPDGPTDFNATVNSSSTVTLFWTPSTHEAGPTYYIIEVSGDVDQTTHNCTDMNTLNITGYNASSAVVENLCSYSHYNFTIMACTSEANSSRLSLSTSVLTGIGVPDGPTDFNATVNSSSTVTLFWTPSTHEAGPTYYIIEVSGDVDQTTHNCTDMNTLNITGYNASSAVVENLCSYSHYNFTIMACTSEANSSSVSLNTSVLTGIGVPDGPTDFNATVNSSSTVTLFWTPSTHEAGPTYYIIEVSGDVDQTTHNCTDMNTLNITGYNVSSAVVENLCSYSQYNFTIMACTSEANSSSVSLNTSVLTGIGVPDGPTDFNATVNSSSTVTLFWTPSTHEAGPTYYIIEVSGDVDQTTHNCTDMNTLNITGYNASSAVVENLCSYSHYNFTIMACTSEANSSRLSLSTSVLTGIGVPDGPTDFNATVNSSSTVTLFWTPSTHEAGPTYYIIEVSGDVDQTTHNCTDMNTLNITGYNASSAVVENLCSYSHYNFTIMACTSEANSSRLSLSTSVLTGIGVPDGPTDFNATVNSSSTVTLFWTPSTHEAGPTYYIIEVSGDVDQTTHNCTDMNTLNITGYNASNAVVENLCSYSHYIFTIMACTSEANSSSLSLSTSVLTGIGVPDGPTDFNATVNSSSTVTLFWTPSTHEAGPTYYIIEVSGDVDQTTHNCTDMNTLNITGYNASSAVVENLCSYSHYNFTIMACTSEANSSSLSLSTSVLTGIGVPDGPTDFNATVNSSSTVTLFWTPSTHEAGPTYYIIEVSGDVDQTTHNCTDMNALNITGYNASSAVVENLCSYSHYNFTIMACTSEANSSSLSLSTSVLTGIGVPDGPTDFNATVNSSSTVTLFWTPSTHEAGPTYYIIEVSGDVDQTTHNCTDMNTLNITGYNVSSAVVENLCSYSHYNFTIMACTSEANSSSVSLNTSVLTGIGVPDGPTDFNATVNSSSTVTLFWTPSTHEAGPTYYIIEVSGDVDQTTHNCTDMNTLNITGYNVSSAVVENLCSYSHYNFTIMACTSEANSSSVSLNTSVLTGIGVPDGPTDFNATVNSSSTVTLFWTPSTHEAGPTYYIIEVSGDVDQTTHNCTDMNTLNITGYNVSSAVVENLCSYSHYNFTIMACTSEANSSSVSLNTSDLTGIGVPDGPTDFIATVNSSSTVTLFWTPSTHEAGPTYYIIEVSGDVDQTTHNCTDMNTLNITGYNASSAVVENLCSYSHYNFTIMACTSEATSSSVSPNSSVLTGIGAPDPPQKLKIENVTSSSLRLSWVPSRHQSGPTYYIVDVKEQTHLQSESYILNRTVTVHGFHNKSIDIDNLTSYWNYRLSVRATTTVHPDSTSVIVDNQTLQSPPGRVENIQASALPDNYTAVKLSWECPEERKRHGPISSFTVQSSAPTHIASRTDVTVVANSSDDCLNFETSFSLQKPINVHIGNNCTESFEAILTVLPEHRYNFTVVANAQFKGLEKVSDEFVAKAGRPPKENSTKIFITSSSATSDSTTDSTFLVSVNTKLLRDTTNGQIVMTGLLVTTENAIHNYPKNWTSLKNWRGWKEWRKNYRGTYRPTPDKWLNECPHNRRKRSTDNGGQPTAQFLVGANANCENINSKHCNGPLEAETTYRVVSVSCTTAGCTASTPYGPFKTKAKSIVAAVVGGLLAALTVVGIVIGGLVYRRRRNKKQQNYVDDDPENEEEDSVDLNRPKKLSDFSRLVDEYHRDSERLFSLEWRDIGQHSPKHPNNNAKLPVNRVKNRYTNILAYDHTRVKLVPKTEEQGSDYINANYIPGYSRPREYIAAQGPVPDTVDDFWQMIWEQNVPIIVQLTDLFEKGQRKLAQYWPEEVNVPQTYGEVQVEIVSLSPMNKYTIKVFKVSLGSRSRHVKHFFLQGWQDFNANLKTGDVIDFTRYVRNELKPTDKGPMVVHCSAGVGRTGTFISVDYFLQVIDKVTLEDYIDIFSFVLKMRDCRPMMVQSENQFIFIHDAVKEMIERKRTALAGEEDELIYENQGFDPNEENDHNIYVNM